jgi:hypothetical protein
MGWYQSVYCKGCGKYLGERHCGAHHSLTNDVPMEGPVTGANRKVYDPDCEDCNPFYHDKCLKCRNKRLNKDGTCTICRTRHVRKNGELKIVTEVIEIKE